MSLESISWFSDKTGFTRETVSKYLDDSPLESVPGPGVAIRYETKKALPILYGRAPGGEQGELMKARTVNIEADTALKRLKEQQLMGELAPIPVLEWALSSVCAEIGAILETLPAKLKRRLPQLNSADIEIIRKEVVKTRNAAADVRLDLGGGDEIPVDPRGDEGPPVPATTAPAQGE